MTEQPDDPEYKDLYGMEQTPETTYPPRTKRNVRNSGATFIITQGMTPGTQSAIRECERLGKPYKIVSPSWVNYANVAFEAGETQPITDCARWMNQYETINIAGNRDADEKQIEAFLVRVFEAVRELEGKK